MSRIHATAIVDSKAQLASDVEVGPYSVIGPHVQIGAGSKIGSHTVIEGHTTLGIENTIAHFAAIGGAPQDMKYRGEPTRLHIGDRNIGQHAMLGGASALVQDIPPFVIAAGDKASPHGINVEGLKRRGFSPETIAALRQAYKVLYKDGLSFEDAKVAIQKMIQESSSDAATAQKLTEFHDFIAASTRGIIR
jgi:UDP-N-acetylglucosamine acyltransferase